MYLLAREMLKILQVDIKGTKEHVVGDGWEGDSL